jgi:PhnB protein
MTTESRYYNAIPYLFVSDGARAIEFYKQAFGAVELLRWPGPTGGVGHAEIKIGDAKLWLADENPAAGFSSPHTLGGVSVCIFFYVADVDTAFARATAAGAQELRPVADEFYGDRVGTLRDPFGHVWTLATRKEDLSAAELTARVDEFIRRSEQ